MISKIFNYQDYEIILTKVWLKDDKEISIPCIRQTLTINQITSDSELEFNDEESRNHFFDSYSDENASEFIFDFLEQIKINEVLTQPIDIHLSIQTKDPQQTSLLLQQFNDEEKIKIKLHDKLLPNLTIINYETLEKEETFILNLHLKCSSIQIKKEKEDGN